MKNKGQIIQMIKEVVEIYAPKSEVFLFGSQARGDEKANSDWDILILLNLPNVTFEFETNLMDQLYELELKTGEIFSPLIYSKSEWSQKYGITSLFENIKREGVQL